MFLLLTWQAVCLAYAAACHSPTMDEPAHLVAGLSHWQSGQFELYNVNPPLVKVVAALPVRQLGVATDWTRHLAVPGARSEFELGRHFVRRNGPRSARLITVARWALIPLILCGGLACYCWSRDVFGPWAGCLALICWVQSPSVLAYGSLITPDAAAASLGILAAYTCHRWLEMRSWSLATVAGIAMGVAQLCKLTWFILFGLWPLLWTVDGWYGPQRVLRRPRTRRIAFAQLLLVLGLGLFVLNAGYGFQGTGRPLGEFAFVSRTLTGQPPLDSSIPEIGAAKIAGNRFRGTWLAPIPVPCPAAWLEGFDLQKRDFECRMWSYLNGAHRHGGWWYFYLEALALKVPLGLWLLGALAAVSQFGKLVVTGTARCGNRRGLPRPCRRATSAMWAQTRTQICLIATTGTLLLLVSSQTGFSRYFRYLLPAFPFVFTWLSQVASTEVLRTATWRWPALVVFATIWFCASSLGQAPHWLSYFNELAGGPARGHRYLIDASIDWGQDLLFLKRWLRTHPAARPVYVAHHGPVDPRHLGLSCRPLPVNPRVTHDGVVTRAPGWYVISAHHLHSRSRRFEDFLERTPDDRVGRSLFIYRVPPATSGHRRTRPTNAPHQRDPPTRPTNATHQRDPPTRPTNATHPRDPPARPGDGRHQPDATAA